jgi:hypothetical protein
MKLPFLRLSSSRPGKLSRKDAKVFAEACQLALLRLEQCIADSYISVPRMDDRRVDGWVPTSKKAHELVLSPAMIEVGITTLQKKELATIYGREVI